MDSASQNRLATDVVNYSIRVASKSDEPFLWQMLYYASHLDEELAMSPASARTNPDLAPYVAAWGGLRDDLGFIAVEDQGSTAVGAAWIRRMPAGSPLYRFVAPGTPELAIAVAPGHLGVGVGSLLLSRLVAWARDVHSSIALSVRATNRAKRLYERFGFVTVDEIVNRVGGKSFVMAVDFRRHKRGPRANYLLQK
jgi:GNAT superfamily N-acetyltransferase